MSPEQRVDRALRGWLTEALSSPAQIAAPDALKKFMIQEMEEAVADAIARAADEAEKVARNATCKVARKVARAISQRIREGSA